MNTGLHVDKDEDAIREMLLGRTVTKVSDDMLELDDGTRLTIAPNEGCGGCSSGWYELEELNDCPNNMVMAVEFECDAGPEYTIDPVTGYASAGVTSYKMFVLAADRRIKLLEVNGTDGNGWYNTGYWVDVTRAPVAG